MNSVRQSHLRLRWLLTSVSLAATIGLVACQSSGSSTPSMFEVKTDRDDAQIDVTVEAEVGTVDIHSESGIGHGQVALVSGQWPEQPILRFHLSGLEGMQFHYDETSISLSVTSNGLVIQNATSDGEKQQPVGPESDYWMPVRFVAADGSPSSSIEADGVIEVEVPRDFLENEHGGFTIEWIDFYR